MEELPTAVAYELDRDALAAQAQAASELQEVSAQIRQNFGEDTLAADGQLAEAYHATPLGRKFLGLQAKAGGARSRDAVETLLNVDKLASPFSYQLQLHADGQTTEKLVDIPETFAYLLGLHVQTRPVYDDDDGRRYLVYRGRIDHRIVAVIWCDSEGWGQDNYQRDRQFVVEHGLAAGADEVFVNGDSFIPNARALEPIFKARMFAPVEA